MHLLRHSLTPSGDFDIVHASTDYGDWPIAIDKKCIGRFLELDGGGEGSRPNERV
jgi:hypothetical protein